MNSSLSTLMDSTFDWFQGRKMVEYHPPWLELVQGDSPLLSSSQCKFIVDVGSNLQYMARSARKDSEARLVEVKQDAIKMQDTFEKLVKLLERNSSTRQRYKEKFPRWQMLRNRNVQHLRIIANAIDEDRENCAKSKAIGSFVSLIGGGLNLAFDSKDDDFPQMLGKVMMGLGNLTTAGTSAVEEFLLREKIDKAREIMKQDKEWMESLIAWLKEASCLQGALDEIKFIPCDKEAVKAAEKLSNISNMNLSARQKEKEIKMVLQSLNISPELKEEMADVLGILVATFMFLERFKPVFALISRSDQVMSRLRLSFNMFHAAYAGINSVGVINNRGGLTESQKRRIQVGMALDVAEILLATLQDSNSVEGQEIRNIAERLDQETMELRKLYEDIRSLE